MYTQASSVDAIGRELSNTGTSMYYSLTPNAAHSPNTTGLSDSGGESHMLIYDDILYITTKVNDQ